MTFIEAIILGIVQGVTEFLPISSSGHLVLGQYFLGISIPGNSFEIVVHVGTLLSIIVVFRKDLIDILTSIGDKSTQNFILTIILGTIPAILVGFFFKEHIENAFDNVRLVSTALLVTGVLLISTKWTTIRKEKISILDGVLIGIAQACAIIPGISRSGSTIGLGLLMGLDPKQTARFSFILAIPALFGSGLLTTIDTIQSSEMLLPFSVMIAGFLSSFLVGWISLKWLINLLQKGKFYWFGVYCLMVGAVTLFL